MANRPLLFRKFLEQLTPEKIELLLELEKSARLVTHVNQLIGEPDKKGIERLCKASEALRSAYEQPESEVVWAPV